MVTALMPFESRWLAISSISFENAGEHRLGERWGVRAAWPTCLRVLACLGCSTQVCWRFLRSVSGTGSFERAAPRHSFASAFDPLQTIVEWNTVRSVNKILAVVGMVAVVFMTADMLATANAYLWKYSAWAWGLILVVSPGLFANPLAQPHTALSPAAIAASILMGFILGSPALFRGDSWWPVWVALGIMMPLIACWLLKSFSLAFWAK